MKSLLRVEAGARAGLFDEALQDPGDLGAALPRFAADHLLQGLLGLGHGVCGLL